MRLERKTFGIKTFIEDLFIPKDIVRQANNEYRESFNLSPEEKEESRRYEEKVLKRISSNKRKALGIVGTGIALYGGKKLYDRYKAKKKSKEKEKTYSKDEEEKKDKKPKRSIEKDLTRLGLLTAAGVGLGRAHISTARHMANFDADNVNSSHELKGQDKEAWHRLVDKANKTVTGGAFEVDSAFKSHYASKKASDDVKKRIDELIGPNASKNDKLVETFASGNKSFIKGDSIQYKATPGVLAHELGHAQSTGGKERGGSRIGKLLHSHTAMNLSRDPRIPILESLNGVRSGIRAARLESKGKKEGKISKHSTWLIPALRQAVVLGQEFEASRLANKNMKEAGFSKETIAKNNKENLHAFGTYATAAGLGVVTPLIARQLAKSVAGGYYKLKEKRRRKKEEKKKEG